MDITRYKKIIPDWEKFEKIMNSPLPIVLRTNTLKITSHKLIEIFKEKNIKIKTNKYSPFLLEVYKVNPSSLLEHYLGYYYLQEASSLIAPLVLNPSSKDRVLDLCAAPGGKTTFLAQLMKNKGLIVANDVNFKRLRALMANIYRLGVLNTLVTNYNGLFFSSEIKFDKVLLDAPCSAEANIRKSPQRFKVNLNFIKNISGLQKGLLLKAIDLVKKNGIVVYSTCTFSPEENEEVIEYALQKRCIKLKK
jgi:NOL1/NOP2/sun family putative RNA methylase